MGNPDDKPPYEGLSVKERHAAEHAAEAVRRTWAWTAPRPSVLQLAYDINTAAARAVRALRDQDHPPANQDA